MEQMQTVDRPVISERGENETVHGDWKDWQFCQDDQAGL